MSFTITFAPSSASRLAMPSPKPEPAPVTIATLFFKRMTTPPCLSVGVRDYPARRARRSNPAHIIAPVMNLDRVTSGVDVPNDCNVIIEIPMNAEPIKYEIDKQTGAMFVDRFLSTAMHYPCNYGYVPRTLSGDGDPVDVLVVSPLPIVPGAVVRCRPIGMLKMEDEAGDDTKVLAVPIDKLSPLYRSVQSARDLPEITLAQIAHFFEHYKDLERGKWVKVRGLGGPEEAKREIVAGVAGYKKAKKKPAF